MRNFRILENIFRRISPGKKISCLSTSCINRQHREYFLEKRHERHPLSFETVTRRLAFSQNDNELEELEDVDVEAIGNESFKNLLFSQHSDQLLLSINNCVSVEEILDFFNNHQRKCEVEHITQTVLVLRDLQLVSLCYNQDKLENFGRGLLKNNNFMKFLQVVENKLEKFDEKCLSYLVVHINKLGIDVQHPLMQKLFIRLRDLLLKDFKIAECSRLFTTIFREDSVRPIYISIDLIPKVISCIGTCETVAQLADISKCLYSIKRIVSEDTLKKYQDRLQFFLKTKRIKSKDCNEILEVITFLNCYSWRHKNAVLSSECMLLLKDEISPLKLSAFLKLFQIFYKNQEPGEILNSIQRCSAKNLQDIEEGEIVHVETHLKLFASLIYFSSPINRVNFQKDIKKIFSNFNINNCKMESLILLRKVFSFVKIADRKLCEEYWDLTMNWLDENYNQNVAVKLCQNYLSFSVDLDNFRYKKFENKMISVIHEILNEDLCFPNTLAGILSFYFAYGTDKEVIELLLNRFEDDITQFKPLHCLRISEFFEAYQSNPCISHYQLQRIKKALNKITARAMDRRDFDFTQHNILIRAAILRNDIDNIEMYDQMTRYKEEAELMSSKMIETICFLVLKTSCLVPEVLNKCTEYVINHPYNITGFNAEKLMYICYYLAYYPINADTFFQIATDIIFRDFERLSGLSILHCALSLAYFNKLPGSFIKQIFNVEFLDKLDTELANCYSKEKYPRSVRNNLMQLNRAVCLEYPEYNIPWFHKKYGDEIQSRYVLESDNHFQIRFKDYLSRVLGTREKFAENVVTPYGYLIDFIVSFDEHDTIVVPNSDCVKRRLALLLIRPYGFTKLYIHLKGKHQLKKRHLEMLGYEVKIVIFNEWINLLYADERIDYVKNLLSINNESGLGLSSEFEKS